MVIALVQPMVVPESKTRQSSGRIPVLFWLFAAALVLYGIGETMFGNWGTTLLVGRGVTATSANNALAAFWASVTIGRLLIALSATWVRSTPIYLVLPWAMAGALLLVPAGPHRHRRHPGVRLRRIGLLRLLPHDRRLRRGDLPHLRGAGRRVAHRRLPGGLRVGRLRGRGAPEPGGRWPPSSGSRPSSPPSWACWPFPSPAVSIPPPQRVAPAVGTHMSPNSPRKGSLMPERLRRHHHRNRSRRRNPGPHPGLVGQTGAHARARALPPAGDGELVARRCVHRRQVHLEGHLVRRRRHRLPAPGPLLRGRRHQAVRRRPLPPATRGLRGDPTTSTGSRPPGRSATTSSSPSTPRPSSSTRSTAPTAKTPPKGPSPSPTPHPRSAMSRASRRSPTPSRPRGTTRSRHRAASCSTSPTATGVSASAARGATAIPAWSTPRPTPRSWPSGPASSHPTSPW